MTELLPHSTLSLLLPQLSTLSPLLPQYIPELHPSQFKIPPRLLRLRLPILLLLPLLQLRERGVMPMLLSLEEPPELSVPPLPSSTTHLCEPMLLIPMLVLDTMDLDTMVLAMLVLDTMVLAMLVWDTLVSTTFKFPHFNCKIVI